MTEDGYLMLTIARNMAIGLGMSVSEGTIHSNGVQPLATFLFTLPYLLTGGDKVAGLVGSASYPRRDLGGGDLFGPRAGAADCCARRTPRRSGPGSWRRSGISGRFCCFTR